MSSAVNFQHLELFKNILPETLQTIRTEVKQRHYPKGTLVLANASFERCFCYIITGYVKLFKETYEGEEVILDLLSSGYFFGEQTLFEKKAEHLYSIQAVSDLELFTWSVSLIRQLIDQDHQLAINFLKNNLLKQNDLAIELQHLSHQKAEQRLGCLLLRLCGMQETTQKEMILKLPYDKALIAARLNMRPETFSRAMQKVSSECNIDVQGHVLKINSIELLQRYACENCSQNSTSSSC